MEEKVVSVGDDPCSAPYSHFVLKCSPFVSLADLRECFVWFIKLQLSSSSFFSSSQSPLPSSAEENRSPQKKILDRSFTQ